MKHMKWIAGLTAFVYILITIWVCTYVYNSNVVNGNWGSVSDILIAIFTGLISWATILLLVAAWFASKEWLREKQYEQGLSLLANMVAYFSLCWERRVILVKSFNNYKCRLMEDIDINHCSQLQSPLKINECIKNVKAENVVLELEFDTFTKHLKDIELKMEKLHGQCLIEASLFELPVVVSVEDFIQKSNYQVHDLTHPLRKLRV